MKVKADAEEVVVTALEEDFGQWRATAWMFTHHQGWHFRYDDRRPILSVSAADRESALTLIHERLKAIGITAYEIVVRR